MPSSLHVVLAVVLALAAASLGAPSAEISPAKASQPEAGIIGVWVGALGIVPYTASSSGYVCTSCQPISAFSVLTFGSNFLMINISAASSSSCSVNAQSYVIYDLRAYSTANFYSGTLYVENQRVPVCFYMDTAGVFTLSIDGQGTCPVAGAMPSCRQGWAVGTVTQTWGGPFSLTYLPQGRWTGSIGVVPYTPSGSGYVCTACSAVASNVVLSWSANTLTIAMAGGRSGSCSLNQQTAYIGNIVDYTGYAYYYKGTYFVNSASAIPVCFFFDYTRGILVFRVGDQGCPRNTDVASCTTGSTPGSVVQTWYASVRLN